MHLAFSLLLSAQISASECYLESVQGDFGCTPYPEVAARLLRTPPALRRRRYREFIRYYNLLFIDHRLLKEFEATSERFGVL